MVFFPAFGAFWLFCVACTEPAPLYGTWSDNRGNTFSFYEDGTFNARVTAGGINTNYEGTFSVLLNALTLNCNYTIPGEADPNDPEKEVSDEVITFRIVTEWDIRGNMLYLDWVNEEQVSVSMTLYKISN